MTDRLTPSIYKGLYIGDGLVGGSYQDQNFKTIADMLEVLTPPEQGYVWDDARSPGLAVEKGASAPDLIDFKGDSDVQLYGFDGANTREVLKTTLQLPHGYKAGTAVRPHIHWCPSTGDAGGVVWQIKYSWASVGTVFPDLTLAVGVADPAEEAWMHQIRGFDEIPGDEKKESSQLVIAIIRDPSHGSDDYGADAGFIEFDVHFQREKDGTVTEYPT